MVEIFKTNVGNAHEAEQIIALLNCHFPHHTINFDLHDCDKILRIKGDVIYINQIEEIVSGKGFLCMVIN